MHHAPRMSFFVWMLIVCAGIPSGARAAGPATAPAPTGVTVSPERAALLAATPTDVPMGQTEVGWVKGCVVAGQPDNCSVSGGFSLKPDTPPNVQLTLGTLSTNGTRSLSVLLPLNVALRPGFTVALENGQAVLGTYASCSAIGCSGQVGLSYAAYEQLLHSKQVGLLIRNGGDKALRLAIPLDGLATTIDGPALTPAEMARRHDAAVEKWKAAMQDAKRQ